MFTKAFNAVSSRFGPIGAIGRKMHMGFTARSNAGMGTMKNLGITAKMGAHRAGAFTPMGKSTLGGMGLGAGYGAISDDTSILGGAMMGGMIGAGGFTGYNKLKGMDRSMLAGYMGAGLSSAQSAARSGYGSVRSTINDVRYAASKHNMKQQSFNF